MASITVNRSSAAIASLMRRMLSGWSSMNQDLAAVPFQFNALDRLDQRLLID